MLKHVAQIQDQLLGQAEIQTLLKMKLSRAPSGERRHLAEMLFQSQRTTALLTSLQQQIIQNAATPSTRPSMN